MERDVRGRIEGLLGDAVAASVYEVGGTKVSSANVRPWAEFSRADRGWTRANVPQAEAARLAEALSPVLERFRNPDTGHIGFAAYDVIGGIMEDVTIDRFIAGMVTSAAFLGPARIVSAVLAWADGDPGAYVRTWVLRGIELPEPLGLRDKGIRFERLPDSSADHYYTKLQSHPNRLELLNQPVLRIDMTIDPMFYTPSAEESATDRTMRVRNEAVRAAALQDLDLNKLLDALSLVCRSSVYSIDEWNEYGDEMLLMRPAASTGPMMLNVPRFDPRWADSLPLTTERLTRAITVVGQMDGRSDLDVAVSRWKNSAVALDAANRMIDLRTVLESLYAQGDSRELTFRTAFCGAMHLAPTSADRFGYYRKLRDFYGAASRVVHGGKPAAKESLVKWTYETCRRAILKRLGEPKELDWTALMLGLHAASGEDAEP